MKKQLFLSFIFLSILFTQSCIPSLHPLYTEKDLIFIEDLLGTWDAPANQNEGGNKLQLSNEKGETWFFEKAGEKQYLLKQQQKDGVIGEFEARIVKLGEHYFMDFFPIDNTNNVNELWAHHYFAAHTFAKLDLTETHLNISMFDEDFLKNLIEQQQIRIKHERTKDAIVLTASTTNLQKFVTKYANESSAFLEAVSLKRRF